MRDIQDYLYDIYGVELSPTTISNITDRIIPMAKEWQNRPLKEIYTVLFMDAIYYSVRQNSQVIKKAAYVIIGVDLYGSKDILGIWIGENESAKFWLTVLNEIKGRGVKDVLVACVDNLSGISTAISAAFPNTDIQKCVIHQIRNSTKHVSYKDLKEFTSDLKPVYTATSETEGCEKLDEFAEKWGKKYPYAIKSWRDNWLELSTFFKFPKEFRRLIYTTNIVEGVNRQFRKITKTKSVFPNDESLSKLLYMASIAIVKKWTMKITDWSSILANLSIIYENRVNPYL